jgi:hypothetical protein
MARRTSRVRRDVLSRNTKRFALRNSARNQKTNFNSEASGIVRQSRSTRGLTDRVTRGIPSIKSFNELDANDQAPFAMASAGLQVSAGASISPQELDQIVDENRVLKQLHQLINFLGSFNTLNELVPEIVDLGIKLTGLTRGVLATVEGDEGEHCRLKMLRGWKHGEQNSPNFSLVKKMITLSAKDERPYFIANLNAQRASRNRTSRPTIQTIIALPLKDQGKTFGVLVFADESDRGDFNRSEKELLTNYAQHAAIIYSKLANEGSVAKKTKDLERSHKALQTRLGEACTRIRELQQTGSGGGLLSNAKKAFYKNYLTSLIRKNRGSFTKAAQEAGISRSDLLILIQKHKVLKDG